MTSKSTDFSRRTVLKTIPIGAAGLVLGIPRDADAWVFGVIFRVAGYGIGRVVGAAAVGLAATTMAVVTGAALYSVYKGVTASRRGGYSYDSNSPRNWERTYTPSEPLVISISLEPGDIVDGEVLRLRAVAQNILVNDGIPLPKGGRLIIEEDGKMTFADTRFRGYACLQNDRDLTVWTSNDRLVLTRSPCNESNLNIRHDSHDGRLALHSIVGDLEHD